MYRRFHTLPKSHTVSSGLPFQDVVQDPPIHPKHLVHSGANFARAQDSWTPTPLALLLPVLLKEQMEAVCSEAEREGVSTQLIERSLRAPQFVPNVSLLVAERTQWSIPK